VNRRLPTAVALFELRYQLRSPALLAGAAMLFLLVFAATASPTLRLGAPGNVHVNAPRAIAQVHLIFTLIHTLAAVAVVAGAAVRDVETRFAPILFATSVGKEEYLLGRLAGATAASAAAFLVVPLAMLAATWLPALDPETIGPSRPEAYLRAYLLLALPTLVAISAIIFAIASLTRSIVGAALGAAALVMLHFGLSAAALALPDLREVLAGLDPFGLAALRDAVRYWPAARSNVQMPPLEGALLWGRLLWLGLAGAAVAVALSRYGFAEKASNKRNRMAEPSAAPQAELPPLCSLPAPRFGGAALLAHLAARTRIEVKLIFLSPALLVLLVLGLANAAAALAFGGDLYGVPTLPVTREVISILTANFSIVPTIVAIIYAGEAVWRERERRLNDIIDATPLPGWAFIAPKMIAVFLVLFAILTLSAAVGVATQLLDGFTAVAPDQYLLWYLLPVGFDAFLTAVLAVFVQAVVPHKYIGWAVMVLYILLRLTMQSLGLSHALFLYGQVPQFAYSDMNGAGSFWVGAWWFRAHWAAWAAMFLLAAHLLWRRGTDRGLRGRLIAAWAALHGPAGVAAAATLMTMIGTGSWIVYNTDVLNERRSGEDNEQIAAEYERRFLRFLPLPQPTVTEVRLNVELHPYERRAEVSGGYQLTNLTDTAIQEVHVRLDPELELLQMDFPAARLAHEDLKFGYRRYRLDRPMAPGEQRTLGFQTRRWARGFRNNAEDTSLVENGTFLNNRQLAPVMGLDRNGLLQEPEVRRRHGLSSQLQAPQLQDPSSAGRPLFGGGWLKLDLTLSTDADQTPIGPGEKVSDEVRAGRRIARFVSPQPMLGYYSVQSGRYAQARRTRRGTDLIVYHHPHHHWNVDRMLGALEAALDYCEASFGPYPLRQLRVVEFPAYESFAQAFPGTIPASELIAFVADGRDPRGREYLAFLAAHELAHQWWVHQLIPADAQGGTMLAETLAQYSALMVMRRSYGEEGVTRFRRRELDDYLRSRGYEPGQELPLAYVENQQYIHYHKGTLVMSLLERRLGEEAVNRALARLLRAYRFRGPPFARSPDLIALLREEARTPVQQGLITDLFERITLYDLTASRGATKQLEDGRWEVTMIIEAHKFYADGSGTERETPLDEEIEIGLYSDAPDKPGSTPLIELRPIKSGRQQLRFVTNRKISHAAIDPLALYVDRGSGDNVTEVQ